MFFILMSAAANIFSECAQDDEVCLLKALIVDANHKLSSELQLTKQYHLENENYFNSQKYDLERLNRRLESIQIEVNAYNNHIEDLEYRNEERKCDDRFYFK